MDLGLVVSGLELISVSLEKASRGCGTRAPDRLFSSDIDFLFSIMATLRLFDIDIRQRSIFRYDLRFSQRNHD